MAKPKKPNDARRAPMNPEVLRMYRRIAINLLIAVLLVGGVWVGYGYLRGYVEQNVTRPTAPPRVVFKARPSWMTDRVAEQLAASFRPVKARSVFDHEVLTQTTERLVNNPWVAKVHQVRRVYGQKPGDTIEVDCDFRAPIALVRAGPDYWFVDAQGIKLPESFVEADLPRIVFTPDGKTNIRVIEGVRNPPPARAGLKWQGEDLIAGLEMVARLYGQPFAEEIVKVRVDNFAGRIDAREAYIVLTTRRDTQIRWGRPWSAPDNFIEVRPERKLESLRQIVAQYGRVDAKQPWIDVRFDKITYPSPGADSTAQTSPNQ